MEIFVFADFFVKIFLNKRFAKQHTCNYGSVNFDTFWWVVLKCPQTVFVGKYSADQVYEMLVWDSDLAKDETPEVNVETQANKPLKKMR